MSQGLANADTFSIVCSLREFIEPSQIRSIHPTRGLSRFHMYTDLEALLAGSLDYTLSQA
jgi:hypothetical protein